MRRETARNALDVAAIRVVASDGYGITIKRSGTVRNTAPAGPDRWFHDPDGGVWLEELWRIHSGSGIAGNSDKWWLTRIGGGNRQTLGPFTTQRALVATLRKWKRWEVP
jgi:hypothetical protein